jgi:hypothetical protein
MSSESLDNARLSLRVDRKRESATVRVAEQLVFGLMLLVVVAVVVAASWYSNILALISAVAGALLARCAASLTRR